MKLTLKTLGTVAVSLLASPLAEMMVTVGLDMVAIVGGVLWLVVVEAGSILEMRDGVLRNFA